jgi:hypothetical protein
MAAWPGLRRDTPVESPVDSIMQWSRHPRDSRRNNSDVFAERDRLHGFLFVIVGNIIAGFDGERIVLARAFGYGGGR